MGIYLDCCCLQRPFDDKSDPRVAVEAEAILVVLASSSFSRVDYFCTCDDNFLRKAKSLRIFNTKVASPTELVMGLYT